MSALNIYRSWGVEMRDFIENLEDCTDNVPEGYFTCPECGDTATLSSAQPSSNNPYAMPICPDCFEEMIKSIQGRK